MQSNSSYVLMLVLVAVFASGCGKQEPAQSGSYGSEKKAETAGDKSDAKPDAMSQASQNAARSGQGQGQSTGQGAGQRGNQSAPLVIAAAVRETKFSSDVEALGTAKANEAIDVTTKVSNRVTAIRFREGQFVRAGDVLVELDPEEAAADLAVAEAALSDSKSQVNRSRELYETRALSAQQMEQLESTLRANEARVAAAKARLNEQTIRAPFGGRVGLRNVSVGSLANTGTVITTLDDISVMKVDFSVPETFLSLLREGLEIEAASAAYPGKSFSGRVLSVGSRVDPVSRSVVVRAQIANRDGALKPGMFMTVKLSSGAQTALTIPEEALVPERDKQFVFVVRDGKASKTEVVVGRRRPGEVEVLKGLQFGDVVVSEGTQKIRDGAMVRVASTAE